jgi:hypothetical protein
LLVEIGPRFVLNPIRIFRGSFGGQTLFQNPDLGSPNEFRAIQLKRKGSSHVQREESQKKRKTRSEELVVPEDPLDSVFIDCKNSRRGGGRPIENGQTDGLRKKSAIWSLLDIICSQLRFRMTTY